MLFLDLAKKRYSCRSYSDKPVTKNQLDLILEAGRISPSAVNFQPWHLIVIRKKEYLHKIHSTYHREWFQTAPCVIIVCGDHNQSWKRKLDGKDHCDIDVAIAVDHMTLQATDLGLATCWICNFDKDKCAELFNLPDGIEPMVLLPVGYPLDSSDPERHSKKRKSLDEIASYEQFQKK